MQGKSGKEGCCQCLCVSWLLSFFVVVVLFVPVCLVSYLLELCHDLPILRKGLGFKGKQGGESRKRCFFPLIFFFFFFFKLCHTPTESTLSSKFLACPHCSSVTLFIWQPGEKHCAHVWEGQGHKSRLHVWPLIMLLSC